jgi:two-component system chemotaxis response regulator CheB
MMAIRVLIIEDSATMRSILMSRLAGAADIEVVGMASNATAGREMIKRLSPDVLTLDIEIPGMNGLAFLEKIMLLRPTPVIIVSGLAQEGNAVAARAFALGAVACYAKVGQLGSIAIDDDGKLAAVIRQAAQVHFDKRSLSSHRPTASMPAGHAGETRLIAIGSSTGGVEALQVLLRDFPESCPPTMIVQHVKARFTPAIARMLDAGCPAQVVLAEPGMRALAGHIYLAPGCERHMSVGEAGDFSIKLQEGRPVSGHMPSVDVLFQSAAKFAGAQAIGILLSGMGSDGAKGLLAMAQAGAHTIAQDEATCVVFGMPRAAISLGAAALVAPIERIADHIFPKAA